VVVLSRSGDNCVKSACSCRSHSSTVASRLGPDGGGVGSRVADTNASSATVVSLETGAGIDRVLTIVDCQRANVNMVWNPDVKAASVRAFFISGQMAFRYYGKVSSSTAWPSPAKQLILCTIMGQGYTSWNSQGQKFSRK